MKLFQDAPLLKQNLRRFETLSMQITEERFEDGKWKLKWTKKIKVDLKEDSLKSKAIYENDGGGQRTYEDWVIFPDKEIRFSAHISDLERDPFSPTELSKSHAFVNPNVGRTGALSGGLILPAISYAKAYFPWLYGPGDSKNRSLLDVLFDPGYQDERWMKIKVLDENLIFIQIDSHSQYSIDRREGMPNKYIALSKQEDGTIKEDYIMEVTDFTPKNGWLFPTSILVKKDGKPYSRQKIDPSTLEINKPLTPKDFTVKFFPGTRIVDNINNKEYIAGQFMTSADIKELETQLKALVEKAKTDTNKGK